VKALVAAAILAAAALAACWTGNEPPLEPPVERSPATCDRLVATTKDATRELVCARERLAVGDFAAAKRIAGDLAQRFPDSPRAADAEELRGDILVAQHRYEGAFEVYSLWLARFAPHPREAIVRDKLSRALSAMRLK
jgi:hypothetical protein